MLVSGESPAVPLQEYCADQRGGNVKAMAFATFDRSQIPATPAGMILGNRPDALAAAAEPEREAVRVLQPRTDPLSREHGIPDSPDRPTAATLGAMMNRLSSRASASDSPSPFP